MNFTNFQTNPETKYEVLEVIGEGGYSTVSKCRNRVTGELVALKLLKDDGNFSNNFHKELKMLGCIKELDPDSFSLVKLVDFFDYDGCQSFAFEMLDVSVYNLLQKRKFFTLSQIRPMAKQLLMALYGLQCVGVMHTDIKLDNIMLVNHKEQPFKVKLIDFGLAKHRKQVITGQMMQPISFRAPEVILGLPIWEAVDMWSLACCFLHWYSRDTDFVGFSEFDYLTRIVQFLGVPSEKLLNEAMYTERYFVQENSKWRLKTLREFRRTTRTYPEMPVIEPSATNLEEVLKASRSCVSDQEERDMEQFHNLLSKMFELDAEKRITPSEALLHPFITMIHLPEGDEYTRKARELMRVTETEFGAPQQESNEKMVEMAKMETDITPPNPVSCASDDNIVFDATKSPGEISVCGSEKSTKHPSANEDTGILVASTKEARYSNQETSPGEIMVGSICLSTELQSEGEAVNEEVTHNEERKSQLEEEGHSRVKSVNNMDSKTSQTVSSVAREDTVIKFGESIEAGAGKIQQDEPNDASAIEADAILERLKEELPDCSQILEDIEGLFRDGEATEADINQLTRKASKSFFGRLIPRPLRMFFSRMSKLLKPKKPVFRKPNWVKHIPVFKRRSTTSGPSKH